MLVHCSAGDLVGEAGQLVEDLVFIVNGELVARFSADWPDTLDVPTDDLVHAGSDEPVPRRPSNDRRTSVDLTQGIGGQRILRKGAWFGEASVMGRRHVRTASIIAQQPTELAVLNKEEYNRVMNKYPSMAKRHDRLVQEMGNSTVCLADISWSETPSAFQHSATWARRRSMEAAGLPAAGLMRGGLVGPVWTDRSPAMPRRAKSTQTQ
ncbi:unnamed protein product [Prorocentrum cordatum]|uniref:Cyclic nucleotide-binding domain-containing protein n=1 Tax=Prorocentrum cordatum TaxID=2364126 RepID=A0ABN9T3D1_9DINO|nr:unnamed protein product [Polarella glacialis]